MGVMAGFLFALVGFVLGLILFMVFWQIGICGGGDVKLFAAVASWLGWKCSYWLWLTSFALLAMILTTRSVVRYLARIPGWMGRPNPTQTLQPAKNAADSSPTHCP